MGATAMVDAALLHAWADGAVRALDTHRGELDALNVFPVADSDTGTNLYLTLREGREALEGGREPDAARGFARGALVGARGNSGVIVSQYLGELLRALPAGPLAGESLAVALRRATDAAYRAVARPVEGTVLSVARAVAEGATGVTGGPAEVLAAALDAGYEALGRTPEQLAPLRAAGVLDAGGWGLLLVLGALAEALGVRPREPIRPAALLGADRDKRDGRDGRTGDDDSHDHPHDHPHEGDHPGTCPQGDQGGAFEVMYVVAAPEPAVGDDALAARLRAALAAIGDSVAVVGGDGLWQAHVHTDDPLEAVASAALAGVRATQVRVRHIARQAGVHGPHTPALGVVAVTGAVGLSADLARAGAVVVLVPAGAVAGPELTRAIDDTGAASVLVLAADGLVTAAPERPDTRTRMGLSEVQVVAGAATFAALASAGSGPADLTAQVLAAVEDVRTAVADVGPDGDAEPVLAAARSLVSGRTGLLTVLVPHDVPDDIAARLRTVVGEHVEVVALGTGLPGRQVVLGAEPGGEPAGGPS